MLVLTRRSGESIRIGDDVTVRVVEIHNGQVRLAIEAPRSIPVHREEVYRVVRDENVRAARLSPDANPSKLWPNKQGNDEGNRS
ncbi:MAG: carbon storage regulator CsrA [bacterium]|nr:carbon storage regulator CsrA [bacterium]